MTFDEFRAWLSDRAINLSDLEPSELDFIPAKAGLSSLYPIEGGQIRTSAYWGEEGFKADAISLSGIDQVM